MSARFQSTTKAIFRGLFLAFFVLGSLTADAASDRPAPLRQKGRIILEYSWPEYPGRFVEPDAARTTAFFEALGQARPTGERAATPRYRKITADGFGRLSRRIYVTTGGEVTDARGLVLDGPRLARLAREMGDAHDRSFFGEPLAWPEVAPFFPIGGTAVVRDIETGVRFSVRRHRGDSHADVEPLSLSDTEKLRRVYDGQWSWRRRAVVITVAGRKVAGSMNGMPHGWGDIFDNQFLGHFCIHFKGSRVHTTWRQDPGHQLMVLKSSGRLAFELDHAAPDRLVYWVLAAIHQHETATLTHATTGLPRLGLMMLIRPVRHLEILAVRTTAADAGEATVEAHVIVYFREGDPQQPFRKTLPVRLVKVQGRPGWVIDVESLSALFERA